MDNEQTDDRTALVPGAHRPFRRLDGAEHPYPGDLVADGERRRVLVDAAGVDTALWEFADGEHVAGVRDLVRSASGHGALLPWCVESVDVLISRRAAAGAPLTAGETVTLVGSLMRGVVEVADAGLMGCWWVDEQGRPLFVPGDGATCAASAAAIVERVREMCTDRALQRVLARIGAGMGDHRMVRRSLDAWERELTELAAPRALQRDALHPGALQPGAPQRAVMDDAVAALAPERVRAVPFHRAALDEVPGMPRRQHALRNRILTAAESLRERIRSRMTARAASPPPPGATRPPRSVRRPGAIRGSARSARSDAADSARQPRTRMLLVGAGVAGLVLLGGMLWPGGEEEPPAARAATADRGSFPEPSASPPNPSGSPHDAGPSPSADPGAPGQNADGEGAAGGVEQAAGILLKTIARCTGESDRACSDAVAAGSAKVVLERLGSDAAGRSATLIEDYGDIAVLRLASTDRSGEQMLVMVREKDGWLVRDVYDVADQPSGAS
ncbi:hypothetical protein Q9R19_06620 [Microbacterium sp. ARD32]|uniref:hypothetical protein n=1 Tax=Microbacterium sp. ARD32 TaxID=2962577 RepID=UPI002881844D|nr:hypothetical protein [Microbacterium sp. ARD32]MDT0157293.1 hypothetical protein [Microbacterium sp. ARD32]